QGPHRDPGPPPNGSPASAAVSVSSPRFSAGEATAPTGTGGAIAGRSPAEPSRTAGSNTSAVTPPNQLSRGRTLMPWRAARRPTTWKPIILDTATSAANGSASRLLASASSTSLIPIPWSSISITEPLPVGPPEISTLGGGEGNGGG